MHFRAFLYLYIEKVGDCQFGLLGERCKLFLCLENPLLSVNLLQAQELPLSFAYEDKDLRMPSMKPSAEVSSKTMTLEKRLSTAVPIAHIMFNFKILFLQLIERYISVSTG